MERRPSSMEDSAWTSFEDEERMEDFGSGGRGVERWATASTWTVGEDGTKRDEDRFGVASDDDDEDDDDDEIEDERRRGERDMGSVEEISEIKVVVEVEGSTGIDGKVKWEIARATFLCAAWIKEL